jgi:hypothetical protein
MDDVAESTAGELARLSELHRQGVLTTDQFERAKERVLSRPSSSAVHPEPEQPTPRLRLPGRRANPAGTKVASVVLFVLALGGLGTSLIQLTEDASVFAVKRNGEYVNVSCGSVLYRRSLAADEAEAGTGAGSTYEQGARADDACNSELDSKSRSMLIGFIIGLPSAVGLVLLLLREFRRGRS